MGRKTLIVYSSGYGATREVAETIGNILQHDDTFAVDMQMIDTPANITSYDNIIIGSSIRADQLLANTRDFLAANRYSLKGKHLALFILCLTASTPEGQKEIIQTFSEQLKAKYPELKFDSITAFGGKIDFEKLNPVMQNLIRQVFKKTGVKADGSIDSRNWASVVEWANQLKLQFWNHT